MRAEFQVLVLPFIENEFGDIKFIIFKRSDRKEWQFIAGGGENNEKPLEAAARESKEEANISFGDFFPLKTKTMIPINCFKEHKDKKNLYVIPEYVFAVKITDYDITLSNEHTEYKLVTYAEALSCLRYDSNKTALWELNERIKNNDLRITDVDYLL